MSQWYAVRTASGREFTALAGLVERGFAVFMPMQRRWRLLSRGKPNESVDRPLIPGYLFVLCEPEDFAAISDLEAVHAFVTYTCEDEIARPIAFPLVVILGLQADERAGVFDYTKHTRVKYRPKKGDRVKVKAGTWLSFIGKVLETPRGERAHVMLEGPFGRGMVLDLDHIEAA